jgi:pilus assembly protein Flp/PilA
LGLECMAHTAYNSNTQWAGRKISKEGDEYSRFRICGPQHRNFIGDFSKEVLKPRQPEPCYYRGVVRQHKKRLPPPIPPKPILEEDTMDLMLQKYLELRNSEEGQTMAEYGLLLALIAVLVIAAISLIGTNLSTLFSTLAGNLAL